MTRNLALITMLMALAACGETSQNQQRASLASNNSAQWETLIASDTMAYVNNRNLIQMR